MALTAGVLDNLTGAIQRVWSEAHDPCSFTKPQLRQAAADVDAWIEANQTSFNNALNAQFRQRASLTQKTLLFCYVAMKRAALRVGGE